MYAVDEKFHNLAKSDAPKTRCRIYFISDSVDCTDDLDVVTNGTLLKLNDSDTDSNHRISSDGISFNDLFNADHNIQIGQTVSKPITLNLLNSDSRLNDFAFGRCKIFLDVYDGESNTWLNCPIGVFIIDAPAKRSAQVVVANGYDQMQKFDKVIDTWWAGINFSSGLTIVQLIQSIANAVGVSVNASISDRLLNSGKTYYESPWNPVGKTFRDALAYIAGVTGTIACFDRDGALDFRWFDDALVNGAKVIVNGESIGNQVLSAEMMEYAVTQIDRLEVQSADQDMSASVGNGSNPYIVSNNPLFIGANSSAVATLATPIYNRISAIPSYAPTAAKVIADWSIEGGDIVYLVYKGNTIPVLIMQQTIVWRGSSVIASILSTGDATRPTQTATERAQFENARYRHTLENTVDRLSSMIQDLSGNYTLIQQTVNSIQQTVSAQGITINNILDPTGELWTAIKTNASTLGDVEKAVNDEISTRQSYIRFLPAEPAIVLGVSEGNEIKLKLVNNIIYFFNGDDDSTDLSLAYAYFNSEESGADRFVANESIQIGTDNSVARWQMKELANGDLVLDLI